MSATSARRSSIVALRESQDDARSPAHSIRSSFSSPEAEITFFEAEVERLKVLPDNPHRFFKALLILANAYLTVERFEDAEPLLLRVREQMVKLWGWDHICTQSCVTSLTKLFVSKDNLDDAQTLYTEALKGTRRAVGSEHPWTSQLQNNNACFCINRNDLSTAETLLRQALRAKSTVFGPNHGNTLKTKCNLALVSYLSDGASAALEAELLSILARLKEAWGENNSETKAVAKQLISLYFETENAAAGHQLCRDLKLDPSIKNEICITHPDHYIPLPGKIRDRRNESTPQKLNEILSIIGPEYGKDAVKALNWTREKIMKWTGIGVTEFADLIGVPRIFDWGNLTDARELLKEAAILGHEATVRMLLGKGDQVKDKKAFEADVVQALHYSCFYDNEWVVRACLEYVSDVNAADVTGQTALHKAAQQGNEWVVAALLEFGADLDKRDILGITPLDAALAQDNDAVVRLFMKNRGALIASSKSTPDALLAPVYSIEAPALDRFTGMNATTVDFYVELSTEGYEEHRVTQTAVETLVWGEDFGRNDDSERRSKSSHISSDLVPKAASVEPDFKWIHIPANNMLWVEALMAKLYAEHDKKSAAPDLMKPELWSDKQHRSEEFTVHSRFMKPSCRHIQEANAPRENLVLFMPYIHWELEDARNVMSGHVKRLQKLYDEQAKETVKQLALDYFMELMKKDKKERPGDVLSPSTEPDVLLLEDYLFNDPPLHIRRTLDQFHYYTTDNTDVRDSDQVISRYLRRKFPEQPVPLVMIDQLWMWVIDDKTVVTSFPQRWGEHAAGTDFSTFMNTTDVLDSVLRYLDSKFRDPITSASALAESIMTRCLGLSFDRMEWHHERYRYLEIFEYSINYVADEETRCFNHFADRGKESERGKERRKLEAEKAKKEKAKKKADKKRQKREKSKQNQKGKEETQDNDPGNAEDSKAPEVMKLLGPSALGEELEDIFDISREIELLKEIKDIRDELNILRNLFDQQKRVLESFCPTVQAEQDNINAPAPKQGLNLLAAIQRQIDIVATMDENAKRPYKALEDLLDLKQKQANVSEARIARISGNTITVFTVVTIIFLPASFMAAFLALPITEYPKTEANYPLSYALKYTIITTAAMAVPFVTLALYVNPLLRLFKVLIRTLRRFWKRLLLIIRRSSTTIKVACQLIWSVLKGLGLQGFVNLLRLLGHLVLFPLRHWKRMIQAFHDYKQARTVAKDEGTEWSKRRFAIGRFIAWQQRKQAKRPADPERPLPERRNRSRHRSRSRGRSRSRPRSIELSNVGAAQPTSAHGLQSIGMSNGTAARGS